SGRNLPALRGSSRTCRPDRAPAPSDRRRVLVISGRPPDAIFRAIPSRRGWEPTNPEPPVQLTAEPRAAYVPHVCTVRRIRSFTCAGVLGGRVSHRASNLRCADVNGRQANQQSSSLVQVRCRRVSALRGGAGMWRISVGGSVSVRIKASLPLLHRRGPDSPPKAAPGRGPDLIDVCLAVAVGLAVLLVHD